MTDQTPHQPQPQTSTGQRTPDQRRRRLLQASMSAPLLATLQTSTAYAQANASAFQCVAEADKNAESQVGLIDGTAHDVFVRVSIYGFTYASGNVTKEFWDVSQTRTTWAELRKNDVLYAEDGTYLTVANNGNKNGTDNLTQSWTADQGSSPINRMALVMYDPDAPDYLHVTTVGELTGEQTPVYPKFQIDQGEQIGMPATCLCSVTGGSARVCGIG